MGLSLPHPRGPQGDQSLSFCSAGRGIPVFAAIVIAVGGTVMHLSRRGGDLSGRVLYVFLFAMSGGVLAASIRGVYPFGGLLRQQFILFSFLVVGGFLLVDEAMSRWNGLKVPLGALALTAGCLSGLWHVRVVPARGAEVCIREMNVYQRASSNSHVVYTDRVGLIVLFAHHDQWQWRAGPREWGAGRLDRYVAARDGQTMVVLRDRGPMDPVEERTYRDLAWSLRTLGLKSGAVFAIKYLAPSHGPSGGHGGRFCGAESSGPTDEAERRRRVMALAARHQLEAGRRIFDGASFFGGFEGGGGRAERAHEDGTARD